MAANSPLAPPETSGAPAEWTPEQQIAHMLDLCEAQMNSAMQESDRAVDALIKAFTGLVDTTRSVGALAESLPMDLRDTGAGDLNDQVTAIRQQMSEAVVAFQFYDKLSQRLGHVRYSLSTLAMFVCDRAQTGERDQWRRLFTSLRRLYRTEEERQIFQLMAAGLSSEEARTQLDAEESAEAAKAGEVELF